MNEQLTKSEKINLSTTEIAKRIRNQLKEEFKDCKFSVRSEYYSMGSCITISLMESDFKVVKDFKDISERALFDYGESQNRSLEELKEIQEEKHHQLNPYACRDDYNNDFWNNGVFLTEDGYKLFKRVCEIVDYYNYDDSDSMTDYYDVNFSFHLEIGKWNKNFEDGGLR